MGMPLEYNTMIVTKNNEKRLHDNFFELTKQGYRVYPIDIPIEVRTTKEGEKNGTAIPRKLTWENGCTIITYELIALNSSN
ncbi:DUF2584 domain-containing protein [Listeria ilorinensis]|uniref:DUF2584 domain-containing protein n=1 Tax=Listeria ilorinensis TaxID=2867439 RepID=UPI001EF51022|nr:DUF2584 domain-containing protein [Listeria ilorinensis]